MLPTIFDRRSKQFNSMKTANYKFRINHYCRLLLSMMKQYLQQILLKPYRLMNRNLTTRCTGKAINRLCRYQPLNITLQIFVLVFILILIFCSTIKIYNEVFNYLKSSSGWTASKSSRSLTGNDNGGNHQEPFYKQYTDKHGAVHILVGQYMGKGFPWIQQPNLTDDLLNSNNYSPLPHYGENGSPVYVPKMERSQAKRLFAINQFNIVASDMISVNRSLPDVRKQTCRRRKYFLDRLPNTSLIIVFHNEAWSTLVRTVHSAIIRSPLNLIHEIILVDDASQRTFLAQKLDDYMARLSKETSVAIKILRSKDRIGLIRARILGANAATGKVLTFLDAHCETTIGWLEPLLHRIYMDGKAVVCPIIDIINDQNFAYIRSFEAHWGAMNWALNFRWFSVGAKELKRMRKKNSNDSTKPFRSPIMAGGLFSIRRDFFFQLGTYDSHLQVWGGENIELSLRIWQCGGKVEIVPCSHVGHVFRSSSPYSFGKKQVGDVLYANLIRVAEVWLDEWKHFFYKTNPTAQRILRDGRNEILENIQERIQLRKRLKCHSFEWFLENVWPESFFPTKNSTFGQIKSAYSNECLQRPSIGVNPTGKVAMSKCSIEIYGPQSFVMPLSDEIGFIKSDESVCLDVNTPKTNSPVLLIACSQQQRQQWKFESNTNRLIHVKSGLCLTIDKHKVFLSITECSNSKRQTWQIISQQWNDASDDVHDDNGK